MIIINLQVRLIFITVHISVLFFSKVNKLFSLNLLSFFSLTILIAFTETHHL